MTGIYDDLPEMFGMGNQKVRLNPVISEMANNPKRYGFRNRKEVFSYATWILGQYLTKDWLDIAGSDTGFKRVKTPEEMLQRYTLATFRQCRQESQDMKDG